MARIDYPEPIVALIDEIKKLPSIGPRSAERIAVWMLQHSKRNPVALSEALVKVDDAVCLCSTCGFFMVDQKCDVCMDPTRDQSVICVVEQPTDVLPIERSGAFQGSYHCLGGKLSPLDNVTPNDLRIASLLKRAKQEAIREIILAVSSDVEGEATANYLSNVLVESGCKVTRIAQGLPAGGGLEHADGLTLLRALEGRR